MDIIEYLRQGLRPALGCTEPAAVAYAASVAANLLGGYLDRIQVITDLNVFKNGMGVFIPGVNRCGLDYAAAIGALGGDPAMELLAIKCASREAAERAIHMVECGAVSVVPNGMQGKLHIEVTVHGERGHAMVLVENEHTNITRIAINGVEQVMGSITSNVAVGDDLRSIPFADYCAQILAIPVEKLDFVLAAANVNACVSQAGLKHALGIGLGARYQVLMDKGLLSADLVNEAMTLTAAAADARMQGWPEPVMSLDGSGNQGITATLPVLAAAQRLKSSQSDLTRALALSIGVTLYIKKSIGKLSALCACAVAAAIGSSCGITFLLGGNQTQIEMALKSVSANLTGMICDGAKPSCAFKLGTAANCSVLSAMLSMEGIAVADTDGIIAHTADETITNLGRVSNPGMVETDRVIVSLMKDKNQCAS